MDSQHDDDALNDTEFYRSIVTNREMFNQVHGIDYANHQPNKIDFIPTKGIFEKWKVDYNAMQEIVMIRRV